MISMSVRLNDSVNQMNENPTGSICLSKQTLNFEVIIGTSPDETEFKLGDAGGFRGTAAGRIVEKGTSGQAEEDEGGSV